jgi:hypothetical protein
MRDPVPNRHAMEDLWRGRLQQTQADLAAARSRADAVQRAALDLPLPDSDFAYRQALRAEAIALWRYRRVLELFTELVLRGAVPGGDEWRRTVDAA